ncbi:hypothetical protein Sango_1182500 [Sesamum angolense]|uniref:Uncharacterized protein n=1 Tax=Sesamum angolense TaxID=2727404 RepID=A0AAE1WW11_9LAMI|nr:hypothetical protein Sango_1182500 [Sesamum angolense]
MTQVPLCSLTHTTIANSSHTLTTIDGIEGGDDGSSADATGDPQIVDDDGGIENPANVARSMANDMLSRIQKDFNFKELFSLATQVINKGDVNAMAELKKLKIRWIEKFGEENTRVLLGWRLVSSCMLTPYRPTNPPMRPALRAPRLPHTLKIQYLPLMAGSPKIERNLELPQKSSETSKTTDELAPAPVHAESTLTRIFIGKVLLSMHSMDEFAESYSHSTRKALSYVPPTLQNDDVVDRPLDMPRVKNVTATMNEYYFFQFHTETAMEEIIEGGLWLFQGQLIILQSFEEKMQPSKEKEGSDQILSQSNLRNSKGIRREQWGALIDLADNNMDIPWLVLGDFNTVVYMSEVCGSSGHIHLAMQEFHSCIGNTSLITLPMQGGCTFTWPNRSDNDRSLWKCLDRMLVNDVWLSQWPNCYYMILIPRTSDHSPLVTCAESSIQNGSMFRFDNYLAAHPPDFIPIVHNVWRHHIVGKAMYAVTRKLKALKQIFRAQRQKKEILLIMLSFLLNFYPLHRTCFKWIDRTRY